MNQSFRWPYSQVTTLSHIRYVFRTPKMFSIQDTYWDIFQLVDPVSTREVLENEVLKMTLIFDIALTADDNNTKVHNMIKDTRMTYFSLFLLGEYWLILQDFGEFHESWQICLFEDTLKRSFKFQDLKIMGGLSKKCLQNSWLTVLLWWWHPLSLVLQTVSGRIDVILECLLIR